MRDRLFHVCIAVADIEAALDFYCGLLGLESMGKLRNERTSGCALGFPALEIEMHADHLVGMHENNAVAIDLIELVAPPGLVATGLFSPLGLARVGCMVFDVDDSGAIYQKLRVRGDIAFLRRPQLCTTAAGIRLKMLKFQDPFGNSLQLVERIKP